MEIKLIFNVLKLIIIGILIQKIHCINIRNSKEADIIERDTLFNNWNNYINANQRIVIGCFDNSDSIEYNNFIKAINAIESLETVEGLISSKKYSVIVDADLLNSFLEKKNINDIYVEAPQVFVFKADTLSHLLKYEYSAERSFSEDSIKQFIIESASELMTKLDNVHLIENNYYYIDSDNNNQASIYSVEKPFIYLNLKNLNNKFTGDVFNVLKQYENQFNVVYTNENKFMLPPFEYLKYSPFTIIKNVKKRGLEEAYDSSQFSESYVTTLYHYIDNTSGDVNKQDLSYNSLIDFINKYYNNTLIPQKPKKHFEQQINNKVIELKYDDYVLELNNHNYVDITGDVFKDVYVLVYYPWSEDYEKIKPIWNELARNLYYERNNIIIASYNVLDNEVLNTEFKNRNDYPEFILYRSQINDIENNKKKIIMYRREAGFSYESLASWITYTTKFNITVPFNIDQLKLRIKNQGYIGNNAEDLFNRDKYFDYIDNEHLAPKMNYEDLEEIMITSTYFSYQSKTIESHSRPTYTSYKDDPPIPDPIPKAPENFFFKTFIFDDEAVLSIGIKIPYAEYPPKYVGAKVIKERIIRDDIRMSEKKAKKLAKDSVINSKAATLNNYRSGKSLKAAALVGANKDNKAKNAKALAYENKLDTMNLAPEQKQKLLEKNANNLAGAKGAKLNEFLSNSNTNNAKLNEPSGNSGSKAVKLDEALGNTGSKAAKLDETLGSSSSKGIKLKEALNNSGSKGDKLNEALNNSGSKGDKLKEALGNSGSKAAKLNETLKNSNSKNSKVNETLNNSGSKGDKLNEYLGNTGTKGDKLNDAINKDNTKKASNNSKNAILDDYKNLKKRNIFDIYSENIEDNNTNNNIHTQKNFSTTIQLPNN